MRIGRRHNQESATGAEPGRRVGWAGHRRTIAVVAVVLLVAGLLQVIRTQTARAATYTTTLSEWSGGLSCSSWASFTVPTGATNVSFRLVGGGGAAGDNATYWPTTATGGAGGRGGVVTGTLSGVAGSVLWARIGCGGTDQGGETRADGYIKGGYVSSQTGGGGGAASALCLGGGTNCASGTMVAIAAGGGGGGGASVNAGWATRYGGKGGDAGSDTNARNEGTAANGGNGQQGENSGGAGGDGSSANPPDLVTAPTSTPTYGNGAVGVIGDSTASGGGGGGGLLGGGGGGSGQFSCCSYHGGGGGGAGSSWVRSTVSSPAFGATTNTNADCTTNSRSTLVTGQNAGFGGTPGSVGCAGYVEITYTLAPTSLSITQSPPSTGTSGVMLTTQPIVRAINAGSPTGGTAGESIRLTYSGSSSGTLNCTQNPLTTDVNGYATFTGCFFPSDGTYTITATNLTTTSNTPVTTGSIVISSINDWTRTNLVDATCVGSGRSYTLPKTARTGTLTAAGAGAGGGGGGWTGGNSGGKGGNGGSVSLTSFTLPLTGMNLTNPALNYQVGCGGGGGPSTNGSTGNGGTSGSGFAAGGAGGPTTVGSDRNGHGGGGGGATTACLGTVGGNCSAGVPLAVAGGGGGGGGVASGANGGAGGNAHAGSASGTEVWGAASGSGFGGGAGIRGNNVARGGGGGGGIGVSAADGGGAGGVDSTAGSPGAGANAAPALASSSMSGGTGGTPSSVSDICATASGGGGGGGFRGGAGGGADRSARPGWLCSVNRNDRSAAGGGGASSWVNSGVGGTRTINGTAGGTGGNGGGQNSNGENGTGGSLKLSLSGKAILLQAPADQSTPVGDPVSFTPTYVFDTLIGTCCAWSAANLPPTMSIDSSTGVISGTAPTTAGSRSITLTARTISNTELPSPSQFSSSATFVWTFPAKAPSQLVITPPTLAGTASASTNIGPYTVERQDVYGNVVSPNTALTVSLSSTTSGTPRFGAGAGATCISGCTVTIPANASSTTFWYGDSKVGTPTLTASGLTNPGTTLAEISPDADSMELTLVSQPTDPSPLQQSLQLSVRMQDQFANVVTAYDGQPVTVELEANPGGATLSGATMNTTAGVATFSGLSIDKIGFGYQLRITTGSRSIVTNMFDVVVFAGRPMTLTHTPTDPVLSQDVSIPGSGVASVTYHYCTGFTGGSDCHSIGTAPASSPNFELVWSAPNGLTNIRVVALPTDRVGNTPSQSVETAPSTPVHF